MAHWDIPKALISDDRATREAALNAINDPPTVPAEHGDDGEAPAKMQAADTIKANDFLRQAKALEKIDAKRAGELYQQVIDEYPASAQAKDAAERLESLAEERAPRRPGRPSFTARHVRIPAGGAD